MGDYRLGLAAAVVGCLLAAVPHGTAAAATLTPLSSLGALAPSAVVDAAQEAPRFHGKRVQTVYCLRQNYWWFYRPYTTAQEDYARCEPYFHYLEPPAGRRGARSEPYFK